MSRHLNFTRELQLTYLGSVGELGVHGASEVVGISAEAIRMYRKRHPEFVLEEDRAIRKAEQVLVGPKGRSKGREYDTCPVCGERKTKAAELCQHCRAESYGADPLWVEPFLTMLRGYPNADMAAVTAQVRPGVVERRQERDAKFAELCREALREGIARLEYEVFKMATGKVDKASVPRLTAGIFLLKSLSPGKYDDRARLELSGPDGGAIPLAVVAKAIAVVEALDAGAKALGPVLEVKALPEGSRDGQGEGEGEGS